jgi:REP element-mobilizing transposase RayT
VQIIKSITAREIFKKCPVVKDKLWGGQFWSDGYFVSSVVKHGNEKQIEAYVRKQGKAYQVIHREQLSWL